MFFFKMAYKLVFLKNEYLYRIFHNMSLFFEILAHYKRAYTRALIYILQKLKNFQHICYISLSILNFQFLNPDSESMTLKIL